MNRIHALVINPILNVISLAYIDIFYDNFTYMANTLHMRFYVFLWALSTIYGFYFYSIKLWNKYGISFHKKRHTLFCLGMLLIVFIPYFPSYPFWIDDLHIWLFIVSFAGFIWEWVQAYPILIRVSKHWMHALIITFLLCLSTYFIIGHMSAFTELVTSIALNIVLYLYTCSSSGSMSIPDSLSK